MVRTTLRKAGLVAVVWMVSWLPLAGSAPALTTGWEPVYDTRETPQYTHDGKTYGPYEWTYEYIRSFDGTKLEKDVQIQFDFAANLNWNDTQKTAFRSQIEAAIEGMWNNKYNILDIDTGKTYPATVDVTFDGPFNQTVTVWRDGEGPPGATDPGRTDMLNWHVGDTGMVNAHEFGHMIGLYDEYWGGAIDDISVPLIDDTALMGYVGADAKMPDRYYQQWLDYIEHLNPEGAFTLKFVPEPCTLIGFTAMVASIGAYVRRRCRP